MRVDLAELSAAVDARLAKLNHALARCRRWGRGSLAGLVVSLSLITTLTAGSVWAAVYKEWSSWCAFTAATQIVAALNHWFQRGVSDRVRRIADSTLESSP